MKEFIKKVNANSKTYSKTLQKVFIKIYSKKVELILMYTKFTQ